MVHTMGGSHPTFYHREVANKLIILLVLSWDNYYHVKNCFEILQIVWCPVFYSLLLVSFFFFWSLKTSYCMTETLWFSLELSGLHNKEVTCSLLRQVFLDLTLV